MATIKISDLSKNDLLTRGGVNVVGPDGKAFVSTATKQTQPKPTQVKETKKKSFRDKLKSFGLGVIKSEKGFGESIAGAIQTQAGQPAISSRGINPLPIIAQAGGITASQQALNEAEQRKQETIDNLITRIQEKRSRNEDTTRLMGALQTLSGSESIDETSFNLIKDKTAKQVVGEGIGVAADIIGAGTIGTKGAGLVSQPTSFLRGAAQGAKTGATVGAGFGAVQGGARAAQDEEGVIGGAITGGLVGAAAGGVLGAATGGVSGAIRGRGQASADQTLKNITPTTSDITPTQYANFVKEGRIIPKTKTSPAQLVLTAQEKAVVNKFPDLITKDPVATAINITNRLSSLDDEVGVFLRANDGIFNNGELRNSITKNLADISDVAIDEKRIATLKTKLIDNFIKSIKTNKMSDLWQARKSFDSQIKSAFSGSPTLQKEVKRELRNAVQDFLSERTSSGTYTGFMQDMSGLFKLRDIAIIKGGKEKVASGIGLWIKNNPLKAKALGLVTGGFLAKEFFVD